MRIPVKYIVQIDNFHVADFIFYWNYYGSADFPGW